MIEKHISYNINVIYKYIFIINVFFYHLFLNLSIMIDDREIIRQISSQDKAGISVFGLDK